MFLFPLEFQSFLLLDSFFTVHSCHSHVNLTLSPSFHFTSIWIIHFISLTLNISQNCLNQFIYTRFPDILVVLICVTIWYTT